MDSAPLFYNVASGSSDRKFSYIQERIDLVEELLQHDIVPRDALTILDSQVAILEEYTRRIRSRINDSQLISRLPPELIGEIVALVAAQEPPCRPFLRFINVPSLNSVGVHVGSLPTRSEIGWVRLAGVCRRWREIVLGSAALWASSVCALAGAEDTMLRRARGAPLTLELDVRKHAYGERAVELVQQNLSHARVVEVHERPGTSLAPAWPGDIEALSGKTFPLLETLVLDLNPTRLTPTRTLVFAPPPMCAPRIRRLELRNIFVPWTAAPNLTELTLIRSAGVAPQLPALLDLLRASPQLRNLQLHGSLPEAKQRQVDEDGHTIGDVEVVELPALQQLSISAETARALAFWTYISIPPLADIQLRLDPTHVVPPTAHNLPLLEPKRDAQRFDLLRALGAHFRPALGAHAPRPICGVSLFDFPDEESLRFCLFTPDKGVVNVGQDALWTGPFAADHSLRLDVQLCRWPASATLFVDTLGVVLGAFDLKALDTFEIMSTKPGASSRWQGALGAVDAPRVVSLDGMPNAQLLDALSPQIAPAPKKAKGGGGAGGLRASKVLFPRLETLYLSASAHADGWLSSMAAQGEVIDMLQQRAAAGAAVDTLVLDEQAVAMPPEQAADFLGCLRRLVKVEIREKAYARADPAAELLAEPALLLNVPELVF